MTYSDDLIRYYLDRIKSLESKIEELEAKLEINQNNYYGE